MNFTKNKKIKHSFVSTIIIAVLGFLCIFNGLADGKDNAITFTRPYHANSWSTSDEAIKAFTYVPVIIGAFLLMASLIILTISFNHWMKENQDY